MKLSLQTKVTVFIAVVVFAVSVITTVLSVHSHKKSIEREVTARGVALSEALARSVDEGLASENLNLINSVEEIVHNNDVVLTQVFSTLWLGVAAVPKDQLNVPPSADAVRAFSTRGISPAPPAHFEKREGDWIDVYHPVVFDPHDSRIPKVLIGYVRLRISMGQADKSVVQAVIINILAGAVLAMVAVLALNALMRKYVLRPILALHGSAARHKQGGLPGLVPVFAKDEIGELSEEFNAMSLALKEREERLAEEKERPSRDPSQHRRRGDRERCGRQGNADQQGGRGVYGLERGRGRGKAALRGLPHRERKNRGALRAAGGERHPYGPHLRPGKPYVAHPQGRFPYSNRGQRRAYPGPEQQDRRGGARVPGRHRKASC